MDSKTIFSFLHDHFLFKFLSDEELGQLLPLFNPIALEEGEILYRTGFPGRNFFLVVSGKMLIEDENQNGVIINSRGHFGDRELHREGVRKETATALESTTLLAVNKRGYIAILSAYPSIRTRLSALRLSANILQRNAFPWIGSEEIIRFIDRKHINVLYGQLLLPALFLILTAIGAILLHLNLGIFMVITVLISIVWGVWLWMDWRNDFYLVTSERAAWVEKVIWLHDQRREVPLQSILSVNISTNQMQRIFGYGDVIIRTYTGNIPMRNTSHPEVLLDLISEAQEIAKSRAKQTDKDNINQAIRSRLGLSGETGPMAEEEEYTDLNMEGGPQLTESITPLQEFLNMFRARYELNGVITYRKHIFVLFKNSWWLWLFFVILLVSFFARLVQLIPIPSLSLLGILLTVNVLALAYAFADWANDRFQITDKLVIDLDRKPFGRETKRSALLENILSLDYSRENIIQRLFDFGTVAINVGDIQLDFENVAQPISVQNEVFEHYNAAIKDNELAESRRRRDDMVEFLAAYHEESNDEIEPLDDDETIQL
ncbi:MAG TPA: cyclic nucleotide-binding domain-containing protein [Chloroflexi bacterium]|nr:cyclic nucleotide-binding domain-containing protein [Chloroflexota bacterium]